MKTVCAILWVALVTMVAGCGEERAAQTQPAAPGTRGAEPVDTRTPRIVSTVPAATLMLVQMGAEDALVGVTKYDQLFLPASKQDLPVVGDYMTLNYETLIRLKPTALVIQTAEQRIEPRLRELAKTEHFALINVKLYSVEDIWSTAERLGALSGHANAASTKINLAKAELAEIQAMKPVGEKPRVLYIVGDSPISIVGSNTFMDEMVTLAGGENVGTKVGDYWPVIGMESLLKLSPEVMLIGAPGQPEQVVNDPRLAGYSKLAVPAAKEGRIFLITDVNCQKPSLDIARHVRDIHRRLYVGR